MSTRLLCSKFGEYLISFGVPSSIDAIWLGHSPATSEKHYASYQGAIEEGDTIEEAMGVNEIMKEALEGYNGKGKYSNLKLTRWDKPKQVEEQDEDSE